ncbi:YIP1 family protein [Pseudooceanicola sp.]|uniref:YIP1 family protein n=1 Tax=Pseudooceanicola sp. TaxID=1914328 RepID=UPI0035C6F2E1
MTMDRVKSLAIETVLSPAKAAGQVLATPVPSQAVWLGLALIAVLNGLYYSLLLPGLADAGLISAQLAGAPVMVTLFILVVFFGMVALTTVCGRVLGGTGDLDHVAKMTVWLQALRFAAQVAISLISIVVPFLGWIASTALGLWGLWIIFNFVAVAHAFTIPKSIATLVMTFIGMVLVLSILSAVFGLTPPVPNGEI